jgi:hypothetical protein
MAGVGGVERREAPTSVTPMSATGASPCATPDLPCLRAAESYEVQCQERVNDGFAGPT